MSRVRVWLDTLRTHTGQDVVSLRDVSWVPGGDYDEDLLRAVRPLLSPASLAQLEAYEDAGEDGESACHLHVYLDFAWRRWTVEGLYDPSDVINVRDAERRVLLGLPPAQDVDA